MSTADQIENYILGERLPLRALIGGRWVDMKTNKQNKVGKCTIARVAAEATAVWTGNPSLDARLDAILARAELAPAVSLCGAKSLTEHSGAMYGRKGEL